MVDVYLSLLEEYALFTATRFPLTNEYILELYDELKTLTEGEEVFNHEELQEKLKEVRLVLMIMELCITSR